MSRDTRDPDVNAREQRRRRPACASAQSDQRLSNLRPISRGARAQKCQK